MAVTCSSDPPLLPNIPTPPQPPLPHFNYEWWLICGGLGVRGRRVGVSLRDPTTSSLHPQPPHAPYIHNSLLLPQPPPSVHVSRRKRKWEGGFILETALMGKVMWKKVRCAVAGLRVPPSGRVKKCKSCLALPRSLLSLPVWEEGGRGGG